jgi:arsenate reductase
MKAAVSAWSDTGKGSAGISWETGETRSLWKKEAQATISEAGAPAARLSSPTGKGVIRHAKSSFHLRTQLLPEPDRRGAGKRLAADAFLSYSAGTTVKDRINPDAVRLMKQLYGIDMERDQRPKLLEEILPWTWSSQWAATWECPYLPSKRREDWGLPDPTGQSDEFYHAVIRTIEEKVLALRADLLPDLE